MSAKRDWRARPGEMCRWPDCGEPAWATNPLIGYVCFHHARMICAPRRHGKHRPLCKVIIHLGGACARPLGQTA
jgi:hypothetical protein